MEGYCILLFACFRFSLSEWVLLPSVTPKQIKLKNHTFDYGFPMKNSGYDAEFCPDFHNLTTMSYGTALKAEIHSRTGWEISLDDVEELLKVNEKLPKSYKEKAKVVKLMGDNLMSEAEQQIKNLFSPSREARTKDFHSPSMESALLTISMLLFGVYLSKLILKLLLSHYNRFNGGLAMMTGIRAPLTLTTGRRKRSTQFQKIHIMHLIDKYNFRFNYND